MAFNLSPFHRSWNGSRLMALVFQTSPFSSTTRYELELLWYPRNSPGSSLGAMLPCASCCGPFDGGFQSTLSPKPWVLSGARVRQCSSFGCIDVSRLTFPGRNYDQTTKPEGHPSARPSAPSLRLSLISMAAASVRSRSDSLERNRNISANNAIIALSELFAQISHSQKASDLRPNFEKNCAKFWSGASHQVICHPGLRSSLAPPLGSK